MDDSLTPAPDRLDGPSVLDPIALGTTARVLVAVKLANGHYRTTRQPCEVIGYDSGPDAHGLYTVKLAEDGRVIAGVKRRALYLDVDPIDMTTRRAMYQADCGRPVPSVAPETHAPEVSDPGPLVPIGSRVRVQVVLSRSPGGKISTGYKTGEIIAYGPDRKGRPRYAIRFDDATTDEFVIRGRIRAVLAP